MIAKTRQRKISQSVTGSPYSDPFPYALMNVVINSTDKSLRRYIQVLFPYPMTDLEANKAVMELKSILNRVMPNSMGVMYFDKLESRWVFQGPIELAHE